MLVQQQQTLGAINLAYYQLTGTISEQLIIAKSNSETLRSLSRFLTEDGPSDGQGPCLRSAEDAFSQLTPYHRSMLHLILDQQARMHQERDDCLLRSIADLSKQIQLQFTIPQPVLLQQPVTFIDANGRIGLLHLDFINCFEVGCLW
jgi:hypothetical protein